MNKSSYEHWQEDQKKLGGPIRFSSYGNMDDQSLVVRNFGVGKGLKCDGGALKYRVEMG